MAGRTVTDVIAPGLRVLFVGINPGLYTAWSGNHFAGPGNRFWPALHDGGFTDRLLAPGEKDALLQAGVGITNVVEHATATAAELTTDDFRLGARKLEDKVTQFKPAFVAILGVGAYKAGFGRRTAAVGEQPHPLAGARLWVLPNPSGLNANYQRPDFARLFAGLREATATAR
ncbi:MAG: G/U mismatch-specific DNA glycosylase [Phycisphaerae bacterium]